ncbi:uncharacterized protein [Ptychodera flava]|uniref:uncharacterized protein n=1 Tax=Ptychodera flava TaxID=63121 RepID=UPI00396A1D1E
MADEVKARFKKVSDAFDAGDYKTVVSMYTKDCRAVQPGKPIEVGRDAMMKGCEEAKASGMKMTSHEILHVDVSPDGEMAYMVVRMEIKMGDGSTPGPFHNTLIWKKVDGVFEVCLDTVS